MGHLTVKTVISGARNRQNCLKRSLIRRKTRWHCLIWLTRCTYAPLLMTLSGL